MFVVGLYCYKDSILDFILGSFISPLICGINNAFLQYAAVTPIAVRNYAARKGTRERKQKAKVKVTVEKVGFIPHRQRDKEK